MMPVMLFDVQINPVCVCGSDTLSENVPDFIRVIETQMIELLECVNLAVRLRVQLLNALDPLSILHETVQRS
jgi:hypothetical protein